GVGRHWRRSELAGKAPRDAVGAKLVAEAGGRRLPPFTKGGGSYLSSSDRRHICGLGSAQSIDKLTVTWPGGKIQHWDGKDLKVDRYWRITEDKTNPEAPAVKSAGAGN